MLDLVPNGVEFFEGEIGKRASGSIDFGFNFKDRLENFRLQLEAPLRHRCLHGGKD